MSAPTSAFNALNEATEELRKAQLMVAELQEQCGPDQKGPPAIVSATLWHRLESIDDRLFEALVKLGG